MRHPCERQVICQPGVKGDFNKHFFHINEGSKEHNQNNNKPNDYLQFYTIYVLKQHWQFLKLCCSVAFSLPRARISPTRSKRQLSKSWRSIRTSRGWVSGVKKLHVQGRQQGWGAKATQETWIGGASAMKGQSVVTSSRRWWGRGPQRNLRGSCGGRDSGGSAVPTPQQPLVHGSTREGGRGQRLLLPYSGVIIIHIKGGDIKSTHPI